VAQVLAFLNSVADECLCWNVVICLINLSNLTAISPKVQKSSIGYIVNTDTFLKVSKEQPPTLITGAELPRESQSVLYQDSSTAVRGFPNPGPTPEGRSVHYTLTKSVFPWISTRILARGQIESVLTNSGFLDRGSCKSASLFVKSSIATCCGRWQNLISRHEFSAVYHGSAMDSSLTPSSASRFAVRFWKLRLNLDWARVRYLHFFTSYWCFAKQLRAPATPRGA
jgi:hypothetical protein